MNAYEKLIKTMRSESDRNRGAYHPLKVAIMTSSNGCRYGMMDLDADDLVFADRLCIDTETGVETILEAGDKVMIEQISELKFAVIDKLREVI